MRLVIALCCILAFVTGVRAAGGIEKSIDIEIATSPWIDRDQISLFLAIRQHGPVPIESARVTCDYLHAGGAKRLFDAKIKFGSSPPARFNFQTTQFDKRDIKFPRYDAGRIRYTGAWPRIRCRSSEAKQDPFLGLRMKGSRHIDYKIEGDAAARTLVVTLRDSPPPGASPQAISRFQALTRATLACGVYAQSGLVAVASGEASGADGKLMGVLKLDFAGDETYGVICNTWQEPPEPAKAIKRKAGARTPMR